MNHRAAEIGYSVQALQGLPLARLIHTSHRPIYQEALRTVLQSGAVQRLELPFLRREGSVTRFAVRLSSMREKSGDASSAVVMMTDVTEASLLQAKLAHAEKMAALGQLVSGVAHEVNNPLSGIVGFTDLLLENPELPNLSQKRFGILGKSLLEARPGMVNALTSLLGNADLILLSEEPLPDNCRENVRTIHTMALWLNEIVQRLSSIGNEMELSERKSHLETPEMRMAESSKT